MCHDGSKKATGDEPKSCIYPGHWVNYDQLYVIIKFITVCSSWPNINLIVDLFMTSLASWQEMAWGRIKNTYELLNLRALKISTLYKNRIFQCMGKIFCVEF